MQSHIIRSLSRHTCWVAAVAAILWPALDAGAQDQKKKIVIRHPAGAAAPAVRVLQFAPGDGPAGPVMAPGEGHGRRFVVVRPTVAAVQDEADRASEQSAKEPSTSRWWLGVECVPVERPLAKHLGLKEGQGLIVMHVVEGSAADEAGLKADDVLVRAGDKELGALIDLVDVVNTSKGEKLTLELIREGEKTTVEVTPKERPRDQRMAPMVREHGPFRFRVLGPGVIEPFAIKVHRERPKLPKDVTVTITATGEEPVRVKVQRGDKSWDVAADQLDQLPDDLQPAVAALLPQHDVFRPSAGVHMAVPGAPFPGMPEPVQGWHGFEFPQHGELQKQIDELRKRVEDLQKQFDN